jgi:MarR family transcriptional regulator, organic hydroperoxide resistance regulator
VSPSKPGQLPLEVLKKFRIIYGAVRHHFREVENTCGISGSQLWVLREVANTPGVGVTELAARLSIHQTTCSQLVEKLCGKGLLRKERSKEDQRRVGLTLTDSAGGLLARAPSPAEGVLPKALTGMHVEGLLVLDRALGEVIERLHHVNEKFSDRPLADL